MALGLRARCGCLHCLPPTLPAAWTVWALLVLGLIHYCHISCSGLSITGRPYLLNLLLAHTMTPTTHRILPALKAHATAKLCLHYHHALLPLHHTLPRTHATFSSPPSGAVREGYRASKLTPTLPLEGAVGTVTGGTPVLVAAPHLLPLLYLPYPHSPLQASVLPFHLPFGLAKHARAQPGAGLKPPCSAIPWQVAATAGGRCGALLPAARNTRYGLDGVAPALPDLFLNGGCAPFTFTACITYLLARGRTAACTYPALHCPFKTPRPYRLRAAPLSWRTVAWHVPHSPPPYRLPRVFGTRACVSYRAAPHNGRDAALPHPMQAHRTTTWRWTSYIHTTAHCAHHNATRKLTAARKVRACACLYAFPYRRD